MCMCVSVWIFVIFSFLPFNFHVNAHRSISLMNQLRLEQYLNTWCYGKCCSSCVIHITLARSNDMNRFASYINAYLIHRSKPLINANVIFHLKIKLWYLTAIVGCSIFSIKFDFSGKTSKPICARYNFHFGNFNKFKLIGAPINVTFKMFIQFKVGYTNCRRCPAFGPNRDGFASDDNEKSKQHDQILNCIFRWAVLIW